MQNAKVYTVFFSLPEDLSKRILSELENKCEGVEFVGGATISYHGKDSSDYALQVDPGIHIDDEKNNLALQSIAKLKPELDGLLLFFGSFCDRRYLLTGLPTIMVDYNAFPTLQIGFKDATALGKRYGTKFITASYSTSDLSESISASRRDDLAEKVELFKVISKMKTARIMDVQVRGFGAEPHEHWWRLNQEVYLQRLKELLGIDVVIVDYRDLFKEYTKIGEAEAKEIATRWLDEQSPTNAIKNKRNAGGVTEEEVTKAAKLYIATDKLMKEYGCNAITLDASSWAYQPAANQIWKAWLPRYWENTSLIGPDFTVTLQ